MSEQHPMAALTAQMTTDPDYAWGWFCNLSVPISDAIRVTPEQADQAASLIMSQLFGIDITEHPLWSGAPKSGAQQYFELRVAAEREEDAKARGAAS
jgi:hypothetical protein